MTLTVVNPDFKDCFVCIATPAGDGNLHHSYVRGKDETVAVIEEMGGKCEWMLYPNCSDLGLARARILSRFVEQKKYTHLLMVDADQGWNGIDVARLLHLREDFIGAAGPMKAYPIKFAATVMDDDMQPVPAHVDYETGVVEVHEVGAAFVLLSRSCAERMMDAYRNALTFGAPGMPDVVAVFDPIVRARRRYSEDFAFCWRWRQIGGKVKLLADICLQHTGTHTFKGALIDSFVMPGSNQSRTG